MTPLESRRYFCTGRTLRCHPPFLPAAIALRRWPPRPTQHSRLARAWCHTRPARFMEGSRVCISTSPDLILHLVGNGKILSANSGPTNWPAFVVVGCLTALQIAWPVPPPTLSRTSFIPTSQVRNFTKPCSKEAGKTLCHGFVQSKTLQFRFLENIIRPRKPVHLTRARLSARSDILSCTTSLKQVPQPACGQTCGCAKLHSALVWRGNAATTFLFAGFHAR